MVRDPSLHPDLRDTTYPFDEDQLSALLGVSVESLSDWRRYGLRRAHITAGHWEVWQPTVVHAFYLRNIGVSHR